jgi:hypothetical protein
VTAIEAEGQWAPAATCYDLDDASECPPLYSWVHGEVVNSSRDALTGFTVTVAITFHDRTEEHVATVDDFFRSFHVRLRSSTPPLSWTASTDGNDAYYGSQASGMFLPDDSPYLPSGPDLCELSWDC